MREGTGGMATSTKSKGSIEQSGDFSLNATKEGTIGYDFQGEGWSRGEENFKWGAQKQQCPAPKKFGGQG